MTSYVILLRGVNLGPHNRVAMPRLRSLLAADGFEDVQTYLQSGNVVARSDLAAGEVTSRCERLLADELGLDVPVVVRTGAELADVVERDPFGSAVDEPKRYQVTFLAGELAPDVARRVEAAAAPPERCVVSGREVYAWHPNGVARSKLATLLAGRSLGVTATARNWTTVTALLALATA